MATASPSSRRRAEPDSWRDDEAAHPPDLDAEPVAWEIAAVHGARYLADRVLALDADAVLAGAGVANLAAWLAVELAHDRGSPVVLAAELGLWGYTPTPADPFIFNHRSFPTATMLGDAEQVLGGLVGGPGTTLVACLGAAQIDRHGNINSTVIGDSVFLVGSGGGNDVASSADEVVVMSTLTRRRAVADVPYVTSPGIRVRAFVTDLALFERDARRRARPHGSGTGARSAGRPCGPCTHALPLGSARRRRGGGARPPRPGPRRSAATVGPGRPVPPAGRLRTRPSPGRHPADSGIQPGETVVRPATAEEPMKLRCASTVPAPKQSPRMSR